jgi:hypothetical protein
LQRRKPEGGSEPATKAEAEGAEGKKLRSRGGPGAMEGQAVKYSYEMARVLKEGARPKKR